MPKAALGADLLPKQALQEWQKALDDPEICVFRLILDTGGGIWYQQKDTGAGSGHEWGPTGDCPDH